MGDNMLEVSSHFSVPDEKIFAGIQKRKEAIKELARRELARRYYADFIAYMKPDYHFTPFHTSLIRIIDAFVQGKIKKLMLSVPPQHGKSELSTRHLVPFLAGCFPQSHIAVAAYSGSRAMRFGGEIKRIMSSTEYLNLFPEIVLPGRKDVLYKNQADFVNIPVKGKSPGCLFFVGRKGGLTGDPVDYLIIDDLYKNQKEADSPVVRQEALDWYDKVAETRLHNNSQQLILFTRWHDNDLIGYIKKSGKWEPLEYWSQLENTDSDAWVTINFPALMEGERTEIDDRPPDAPLYPVRHSAKILFERRRRLMEGGEPERWRSSYQGDPRPVSGMLYSNFKTYAELPEKYIMRAYIDPADTGTNYLCAIVYAVSRDNFLYLVDVYFTKLSQDVTELETAKFLIRNRVSVCEIESNAGGRGFARNVSRIIIEEKKKLLKKLELVQIEKAHAPDLKVFDEKIEKLKEAVLTHSVVIDPVNQRKNKEARVITNAAAIQRVFLMPEGWVGKFPEFTTQLLTFKKNFAANDFDDAPDALTGAYERSGIIDECDEDSVGVASG